MNPNDLIKQALQRLAQTNISPNRNAVITPEMLGNRLKEGFDESVDQYALANHATVKRLQGEELTPEEDQALKQQVSSVPITSMNNVANQVPQSILREGQPDIGAWIENLENTVARERFNIPELQKIGAGSDRDVFDLGDKVLKIAKQARGMSQNYSEGDMYAPVPEIFERGKNYVVTEKIGKPDAKTKQLVQDFADARREVGYQGYDTDILNKVAGKYYDAGDDDIANIVSDLMNYDPMMGDLGRIKNWGTKDELPVLLDAGALNKRTLEEFEGTTNMSNPEFRDAVMQSRKAKKGFGDTDKATMYGLTAALTALINQQNKKKEETVL